VSGTIAQRWRASENCRSHRRLPRAHGLAEWLQGDALSQVLWHNSLCSSSPRAGTGEMAPTGHMSGTTGDAPKRVPASPARAASATASAAQRPCASEPGRIPHDHAFIDPVEPVVRWYHLRPAGDAACLGAVAGGATVDSAFRTPGGGADAHHATAADPRTGASRHSQCRG
jgi:hypothetical protein